MSRVSPQLIVFSYHKTGTSLFLHLMTKVCGRLGFTLENQFGRVNQPSPRPDVVLLPHSLLRGPPDRPYRAIRMIRDPRDIWVSGYLYHLHCDEEWCINTNMNLTPPIEWPQVDHSFAHRPEDWKRHYLERLNGRSYQQNLLDRSQAEGLDFELEGYTDCTLAAMREWGANGVDALDVRLEDVMADFDGSMLRIFDHFGLAGEQAQAALEVARSEDINRMDDAGIVARPQIHSRVISKWRDILTGERIARFETLHGDLIRDLGYELAGEVPEDRNGGDWFSRDYLPSVTRLDEVDLIWPQTSEAAGTPPGASAVRGSGIWLSVDGVDIRPTVTGQGVFRFVVPPGATRVRLESRHSFSVDPCAPYLGGGRCMGVRVSEIAIRFRGEEVVIPADDPRLISGWYPAEQGEAELWRWTDGSAEFPWAGVSGPAVVTIYCFAR
jgi:hypothetical protein